MSSYLYKFKIWAIAVRFVNLSLFCIDIAVPLTVLSLASTKCQTQLLRTAADAYCFRFSISNLKQNTKQCNIILSFPWSDYWSTISALDVCHVSSSGVADSGNEISCQSQSRMASYYEDYRYMSDNDPSHLYYSSVPEPTTHDFGRRKLTKLS